MFCPQGHCLEPDQLAADGERGTSLGSPDPGLDLGEELWVVGRQRVAPACGRKISHRIYVPIVSRRNPELLVGRAVHPNGTGGVSIALGWERL
jgi:hypothetical protein